MGKVPHSVKAQVVTESGSVWCPAGYPRPPPVSGLWGVAAAAAVPPEGSEHRGGVFGKVWKELWTSPWCFCNPRGREVCPFITSRAFTEKRL